ncbi:MAG: tryptophan synthase subunit alpha [Thermoanaerobaculaceae bacterium]|nr:tryptophan synthase subunit alpha [Thermoanaerobaculaceae bacterium]MDI9622648.1 tryptophan synthase subunit alpha [Acidobacteriota bacterium]NLH10509.1 tryptophan synthase subunit alpha [Holophagae bacterium]HPW54603.1 tryptophan synthase subunit alpha [Thermoanaerobaculaceae bacterium]
MSRIEALFAGGRKVFVGFLTVGDGGLERTLESALALVDGGVDLLELGVPHSDPVADGPVIQRAAERALAVGTRPVDALHLAERLRARCATPLLLFSYYNPLRAGGARFLQRAADAGCNAVLAVDLPPENAAEHLTAAREAGLDTPFIVAPTTPPTRLSVLAEVCSGFAYCVTRPGTTGVRAALPKEFPEHMRRLRGVLPQPLVAGFGIADRASAAQALAVADGFVVGSAFVAALEQGATPTELATLARRLDPRGRNGFSS